MDRGNFFKIKIVNKNNEPWEKCVQNSEALSGKETKKQLKNPVWSNTASVRSNKNIRHSIFKTSTILS